MSSIDIGEVAAGLAAHVGALAEQLFPHGQRLRSEWAVGSLAGEPGQSLRIALMGDKRGLWYDHAAGQGGDALDLVAQTLHNGDQTAARRWGIEWLGLDGNQEPGISNRQPGKQAPPTMIDPERKREGALGLWLASHGQLRGTPVDRYLRGRGIDLDRLGRAPRALRYHPELYADGRWWPAMTALIRDGEGKAIGLHRTFLAKRPDGGWGKAPLAGGAKRVLGWAKGGFVPIWRGASGKPLRIAPAGDRVVLTEGIEDALTIALACPEYRVLACISAGNLAAITLPPMLSTVLIAADNDAATLPNGKPHPARLAVDRAAERFQREGRRVLLAYAGGGAKDFNALARGAA